MESTKSNKFDSKFTNGINFKTREIDKIIYRVNYFNYKDIKLTGYKSKNENKIINKDSKLINLNQIKKILSDDDKTSDDEYSDNFSYDEEENDKNKKTEIQNNIDFNDPDIFLSLKDQIIKNISPKKYNWTHFLAIPFNKSSKNSELVEKYIYFKNKLLEEDFVDINESLFQTPEKLHISLCLFELKTNTEIEKLKDVFKETKNIIGEIIQKEEIYMHFDKFEVFGKPHESRVLYAKPKNTETNKLHDILDIIFSGLVENKLINQDIMKQSNIIFSEANERYEKEKLHLTLLNSTFLYREVLKSKSTDSKSNNDFQNFNGMRIIRKFNNFHFGSHKVNEICLYEMKLDNYTNTYKIVEKLTFN